jgi:pilus assembly protein CpaB
VWGIYSYQKRQREFVAQRLKEVEVLAAADTIKRGTELTSAMWMSSKTPETALESDHILYRDRFIYARQVLNRTVERGEFIRKSFFAEVKKEVTTVLPPGEVAVALRVDDVTGVAGTIRPADHVDVIATLPVSQTGKGTSGEVTTLRLLNNCTVLAVDNRTSVTMPAMTPYGRGSAAYSTVTLAVTPAESVVLIFVQGQGKITLALRNTTDAPEKQEPAEVDLQNVRREAQQLNAARKQRQSSPAPTAGE